MGNGGFPFFILIPQPYESFSASYPSAVADFVHFAYGDRVLPYSASAPDAQALGHGTHRQSTSLDIAGLGHAANFTHGWMTAINREAPGNRRHSDGKATEARPRSPWKKSRRVQEIKGSLETR